MTAIDVSFQQVLKAARQVVAEGGDRGKDGWWRSYELPDIIASKLGIKEMRHRAANGFEHRAVQTFDGQAMRAFGRLAEEGILIKVGRGERSPHGSVLGNESEFYTPEAFERAKAKHEHWQATQDMERRRWELIWDSIAERGLRPGPEEQRGQEVTLTTRDWERLLNITQQPIRPPHLDCDGTPQRIGNGWRCPRCGTEWA